MRTKTQRRYKNPQIKNIIRLCRQIDVKIGNPDVAGEPVTPVEDIQWAYRMSCELQEACNALQVEIYEEYVDRVSAWSGEEQTDLNFFDDLSESLGRNLHPD